MSVPCDSCQANCCKNYDVFIDHEDLSNLHINQIKVIEYNKSFGYVPKFELWQENKKKKWVLCLNNPNRECQFLQNDKCSIYDRRPLICQTYPHYVDREKIKLMKNLCPVKWKLDENKKNELKSTYEKLLVNFLAFETICDMWNRIVTKEHKLENFIEYAKNYKFI